MSLADDSIWALNQSTDMEDLQGLWIRVWRKWAADLKRRPPPEVEAVKERRKLLHSRAETDKLLENLQHVLIIDSRHGKRDLEDWMRGVGWGTLKKAKAAGPGYQMPERVEKQVRAIIAYGKVEDEALIE